MPTSKSTSIYFFMLLCMYSLIHSMDIFLNSKMRELLCWVLMALAIKELRVSWGMIQTQDSQHPVKMPCFLLHQAPWKHRGKAGELCFWTCSFRPILVSTSLTLFPSRRAECPHFTQHQESPRNRRKLQDPGLLSCS